MRGIFLLILLIASSAAQATLLRISQHGFDEISGQRMAFSAHVDTRQTLFAPEMRHLSWHDPVIGLLQSHVVGALDGWLFNPAGERFLRLEHRSVSQLMVVEVPEPATLGLLAIGLALSMMSLRRRLK